MQIPVISEDEASAEVVGVFKDVKETLGIPFVSSFFQALAPHPKYLALAWVQVKPLIRTSAFEGSAEGIRARAESAARSFDISDQGGALRQRGFDDQEIARIKKMIDVFHRVDPRLFLIATALRESMREQPVGTPSAGAEAERASIVDVPEEQLKSVDLGCEINGTVGSIFDDIKRRLDLPFINNLYKAMACWPEYLEIAWDETKQFVGTEQYLDREVEMEIMANAGMADLPHPVKADPSILRARGIGESEIQQIRSVLDASAWMLTGLVINVAIFRQGLKGGTGHLRRR